MVWIAAALGIAVAVALALRWLRGATVYWAHRYGYTAYSFGVGEDDKLRPVSRERYERILARFVQGDLFDALWVSRVLDRYGGVVLSNEGVEIELSLSFRSLKETERMEAFRERMAELGHTPTEEHPWNVGMGEDMESLRLEYVLPKDLDRIGDVVDQALEALQGEGGETVFVHAWRSQDGPTGVGLKVRRERDVLAEIP
ncbi:hypothetical protein EON82_21775 [bacterium]|nr:MAG: hypothetical protein EON82_21775 [bacterium]